tara:strand:+ start:1406 stop:1753 length:348 start_codon:yes stop_codon:yes gene_type:complete
MKKCKQPCFPKEGLKTVGQCAEWLKALSEHDLTFHFDDAPRDCLKNISNEQAETIASCLKDMREILVGFMCPFDFAIMFGGWWADAEGSEESLLRRTIDDYFHLHKIEENDNEKM